VTEEPKPVGSGSIIHTYFLVLIEHLFLHLDIPSFADSLGSAFSKALFNGPALIPPLHTRSARMGLQFGLFSHLPRTDIPGSQHRGKLIETAEVEPGKAEAGQRKKQREEDA
jgi:hypothetical protein